MHFLSDVVAGLILGLVSLATCRAILGRPEVSRPTTTNVDVASSSSSFALHDNGNDTGLDRTAGFQQKEFVMAALGVVLIVVGAIIVWGVEAVVDGFDLQAIGYILMAGGVIALLVAAIRAAGWMSMNDHKMRTERVASADGTHYVEQTETH